tara:strand:- start:320 stop:586 length:267 start_codon:yes stop_codon:yes gene_type:complete
VSDEKFTQGEWKVSPYTSHEVEIGGYRFRVPAPHEVKNNGSFGPNWNANLISAAPDMFRALVALSSGEGLPAGTTIENILIKAKGGAE